MILFLCLAFALFFGYQIYAYKYFRSSEFSIIKRKVKSHANECNELNGHLKTFRSIESKIRTADTGSASLKDNSEYNYKRECWSKHTESRHIHKCSATICKNAKNAPFKYLCKYFRIKVSENTLEEFEAMLNNFEAADQGRILLVKQQEKFIRGVSSLMPTLIRIFSSTKIERELGFEPIESRYHKTPVYTFQYISAGGKSSISTDIKLDSNNLERFINYLGEKVKFKKSIAGQRSLMTRALREMIKDRDHYKCQSCGNSVEKEPNLLLEIDHIHPISKGGITEEKNLQTLCWKCNRTKGSKIIPSVRKIQSEITTSSSRAPEKMYEEAKSLHLQGKEEEAQNSLAEIIKIYPNSNAADIARKLL